MKRKCLLIASSLALVAQAGVYNVKPDVSDNRVKTPLAVSIELQRKLRSLLRRAEADKKPFVPKIIVAPAVMQRLRTEDSQLLAELQSEFSTRLTFVSELHRHPESFSVLDSESGQVLYSSGGPTTTM